MRHWKLLALLTVLVLVGVSVAADSAMPPNLEKIAAALVKQGVIPATATPAEREAAVEAYIKLKLGEATDEADPQARKVLNTNEEILNAKPANLRGRRLGNTAVVHASQPQFKPLAGTGKLLLILVEFSETPYTWTTGTPATERTAAGPLHNTLPVPDNSFDLYIPDFNTQHYEDMLFTPGGWYIPSNAPRYAGEHRGSMHDFYLEQSYGQYTVEGKAYGWFKVDKPEAYYGGDRPTGGTDNWGPGNPRTLIADVVAVINAQNAINWQDYDANGDCRIDHPLFIHAGADQSAGGGEQGTDAIWAHSSRISGSGLKVATTAQCPNGLYLRNYTMMPEDGGVGVFAHEYGHDLGLPDEYDTRYSGAGDSNAFWTLMSSGSWVGRPAQTQPSDMSIFGRYALGWLGDSLAVADVADLTKDPVVTRLEQAERWGGPDTLNAIQIKLPDKIIQVNTPYRGSYEWFGGKANTLNTRLRRTVDLTGKNRASLSFRTWYDIEAGWDFGFVQVSSDDGATWTSLPIRDTTSEYEEGASAAIIANLPGFTGNSGGWQLKTADLSAYAGTTIQLQFRYMTDTSTTGAGFYVDEITVKADGATLFADGAETLDPAWTVTGWTRDRGYFTRQHYYLAEWRNSNAFETDWNGASIVNFDNGLTGVYQFDPYASNPNEPAYFAYNAPGLLLWYRDYTYTNNWTGDHPGGGFLLVVDAHKQALMRPPLGRGIGAWPWSTRVQSYDAAFSLLPAPDLTIGYYGTLRVDPGLNALPDFDDTQVYWNSVIPNASVITPQYGLLFRVLGQATDGSAAIIGLGMK